MGVAGALGARDQDVVWKGAGMRKGRHLGNVPAREGSRGREREGRCRPRRDQPRLGAGRCGDAVAGGVLQFADVDRCARRRGHRGHDFGRHHRASEAGERPRGIDATTNAETIVRVCLVHPASLAQPLRPAQ